MNVFATAGLGATCLATALVVGLASAPAQNDNEAAGSQATDSQATGTQTTDTQATDTQATDTQATDTQATDTQATDTQATGNQAGEGEPLEFTHVLDDEPLDVYTPRAGEEFTEAVEEFHVSGENPYDGVDEAIAGGQDLYNQHCQACHAADGRGGMGPALSDQEYRRERAATDKGKFEIIYGGSAGAMQPFGDRLNQDEILRVMAFIDTFGETE